MRLELYEHRRCKGLLCDPDHEQIERLPQDKPLSLGRVAGLLGLRKEDVDELLDGGVLRSRRTNPDARPIVTGADVQGFTAKLRPVVFEEAEDDEPPEDEDDEDAEDGEGDEESVPVLLIPLRKLRELLRGGADTDQAAAMLTPVENRHASAPAVAVAVAPAPPPPAAAVPDAPPAASPDGRQRNPRALPDRPRRRRADGGR